VGLLELAKQLGNVRQACQVTGYGRDSFYRFKELYDRAGERGAEKISRRKPNPRNRMAVAVEDRVVALPLDPPARGPLCVANELAREGIRDDDQGFLIRD
jgi:hypothetical protein